MSNPVLSARGRYGHAVKTRDPQQIESASRDLAFEKLAAHAAKIVASAPPLTPAQIDRVVSILRSAPAVRTIRRPFVVNEHIAAGGVA